MRRFLLVLTTAIAFLLTGLGPVSQIAAINRVMGVEKASAQSTQRRRGLFSILFGRRSAPKKEVTTQTRRSTTRRTTTRSRKSSRSSSSNRSSSSSSAPRVAAPVIVEKAEDAKIVLVVGDFLAGGLADGLQSAYAELGTIQVVDKSNGLSGFVRSDVVDWPVRLPELIEEFKPSYIVAMLGSNDRQLMVDEGQKLKKRTPEWDAAYTKRIEKLAAGLKASNLSYAWMGLPPMRIKSMNSDFLFFNEQYAAAAVSERGKFVDVWDGFSDAEGNYSRSGPDVNGQIVMLRPKDGINLTKAGRQRLAFYVQDEIRTVLNGDAPPPGTVDPSLGGAVTLPQAEAYDPAKSGRTVVIRLDDPAIDGADILAGEKVNTEGPIDSGLEVPVERQSAPAVRKEGRVDNYQWPPSNVGPAAPPRVSAQSGNSPSAPTN